MTAASDAAAAAGAAAAKAMADQLLPTLTQLQDSMKPLEKDKEGAKLEKNGSKHLYDKFRRVQADSDVLEKELGAAITADDAGEEVDLAKAVKTAKHRAFQRLEDYFQAADSRPC